MTNAKEQMNKAYIDTKLSGIIEPMVNQIFSEKPSDNVTYSDKVNKRIDRVYDTISKGPLRQPTVKYSRLCLRAIVNANEKMELDYLRTEVKKLRELMGVRVFRKNANRRRKRKCM